jgi:hypothetical protein
MHPHGANPQFQQTSQSLLSVSLVKLRTAFQRGLERPHVVRVVTAVASRQTCGATGVAERGVGSLRRGRQEAEANRGERGQAAAASFLDRSWGPPDYETVTKRGHHPRS